MEVKIDNNNRFVRRIISCGTLDAIRMTLDGKGSTADSKIADIACIIRIYDDCFNIKRELRELK